MRSSLVAIVVLVLVLAFAERLPGFVEAQPRLPESTLTLDGCDGPSSWRSDWEPEVQGAGRQVRQSYRCGSDHAHVYVAEFSRQHTGAEATSSGQQVVTGTAGEPMQSSLIETGVGFNARRYRLEDVVPELEIWKWYAVGSREYASALGTKIGEITNAIVLNPEPVFIVAVAREGDGEQIDLTALSRQVRQWYAAESP